MSHFCPPPTGRTIFPLSNSVFSQIDVLVNNGGRSQRSLCAETNLDVFQALMDLNFLGSVSITKRVLPHMMQQGRGSIVTVSSIVGLAGAPLQTGYTASKHALQVRVPRKRHLLRASQLIHTGEIKTPLCSQGFFNSLRIELSDFPNILVSTVLPGPVQSKIIHNAFQEEVNMVRVR